MVTKFNTSSSAGSSSASSGDSGSSTSGSGNLLKTILIIGGIAVVAYLGYRYYVRKKQETVVYIDESEEY